MRPLFLCLLFISSATLADSVSCELRAVKYLAADGTEQSNMGITTTIVTNSSVKLQDNSLVLEGAIKTKRISETIGYTSQSHGMGMARLKMITEKSGCQLNPAKVACVIEGCELKVINEKGDILERITTDERHKSLEDIRNDFMSIGMCHDPAEVKLTEPEKKDEAPADSVPVVNQ